MKQTLLLSLLVVVGCATLKPIDKTTGNYLFSVGGEPHYADEFFYAFSKNNQTSTITKDSIDNYLDLYIKFRLKVKEAKMLGYDTTQSFKKEFAQYKAQLDESYLNPKKEQEALIKEAYNRSLWEIKASHILVEVEPNASPVDTTKAFEEITALRNRVINGEKFNQLARQFSDDPSAPSNGGELGYFSALQMVYPFENAAYETPVGEVSQPIRTRFGYHIIKVEDKRKNEGKVQVAHIMVRVTSKDNEAQKSAARAKINKVDSLLKSGADWNKTCKSYSEDQSSVFNNGMLRPFGRGQIVPKFEVAAFSLANPGDISNPIQTQYGWHIIKLLKKMPVGSFEEERDNLARKVSRDSRSSLPEDEMMKKLKAEYDFRENKQAIEKILHVQKDTISYLNDTTWLYKIGSESVDMGTFLVFTGVPASEEIMRKKLDNYEMAFVKSYASEHLTEKYPDYKYLVNEYYDGILLFSIMEDSVWNKSVTDTLGMGKFYEAHKANYKAYTTDTTIFYSNSESVIDSVILRDGNDTADWEALKANLLEEYNISPLTLHVVSKKEAIWNQVVSILASRNSNPLKLGDTWYWVRVGKEKKVQPLNKVKGKVITEYQNMIDEQWIERLKTRYPVSINKKELKKVYAHFDAN